ncbi:hypothetical protein [Treponema brennaborense]|uniref:Lipopolysaccharide assembly protein A domain-containing protein n=1 Tax=Treponema brennaborense (strain DSM 12168 / CIP 105900 / DD5/3) TaxID=906968 RepID=F4LPY0_TREBD|nr:hypothetical protein [Treponema brennaborense]AEE16072.1 hypothetical protein Trebr_0630 [Treponema brennaborense DSM 12168]
MPWRLISFIVCLILITIFAGFNLDNKCNISFGFTVLPNIPIFLSLMASFLIGVVVMLPFTFGKRRKDRRSQPGASAVPNEAGKSSAAGKPSVAGKATAKTPVVKTSAAAKKAPPQQNTSFPDGSKADGSKPSAAGSQPKSGL